MDPRLLEMIRAFQAATSRGLAVFLALAALPHPFDWRAAGLPRTGTLAGEPPIEYAFHGIGLRLTLGAEEIDFDFGFDGRTRGFNEYWLGKFASQRPTEFPEFRDRVTLRAALTAAKEAGEVVRPYRDRQDELEYLSADVT